MTKPEGDLEELKGLQREASERRAARNKARSTAKEAGDQQSATAEAPEVGAVSTETVVPDTPSESQPQEAETTVQDFVDQFASAAKEMEELANERPLLALLAAFSFGIIVGQLFSRR